MEYRNYYSTPRDSVSDDMLTELLRENEPVRDDVLTDNRQMHGQVQRMENPPQNMHGDMPNGTPNGTPNCRGIYPAVPAMAEAQRWVNPRLEGNPLAMVYSPDQEWEGIYEAENALRQGTLFKKLDLDFCRACCGK